MDTKNISDWATALSLPVAALSFAFTMWTYSRSETEKQIQKWQRVVVFGIIEKGPKTFEEIKSKYLDAAQQVVEFRLPRKAIQDHALQLALMSLITELLIARLPSGVYLISVASPNTQSAQDIIIKQTEWVALMNELSARIFEILELDSGKFTIEKLSNEINASGLTHKFSDLHNIIRTMIDRGSVVQDQATRTLSLRSNAPVTQRTSGLGK